jgi:hypothetical protein
LLSRLRLLWWLALLLCLRLFPTLGCEMLANDAAGCRAQDCMMAGHVAGDGADCGAFDAAFGVGSG